MKKYLKYIIKQFRIWYWYHKYYKIDKYDYDYNNWKYIKLWTFKRKDKL